MTKIYRSPILPAPAPDNVNLFHLFLGDPAIRDKDPRFESSVPIYVDVPTGVSYTFKQLFDRVEQLGKGILDTGVVGQGDGKIGIFSKNTLDYPTVVLSAIRIGVPFVTMSFGATVQEAIHYIVSSGISLLFVHPSLLQLAKTVLDSLPRSYPAPKLILITDPNDPTSYPHPTLSSLVEKGRTLPNVQPAPVPASKLAWVLFSSGTTSLPKPVGITHKNVWAQFLSLAAYGERVAADIQEHNIAVPINPGEGYTLLAFLPMYHAYGLVVTLLRPLMGPNTVCIMPNWKLEPAMDAIERYKISFITLVPPILQQILASPIADKVDFSSLKIIGCGAAMLTAELEEEFTKFINDRRKDERNLKLGVSNGYGMSECVVSCTHSGLPSAPPPPKSVGFLYGGLEARLIDPETLQDVKEGQPGELVLRGEVVMQGYLNEESNKTAFLNGERGDREWLRTGDEFKIDSSGYLYYVDRLKDIFKSNGSQVSPTEITNTILNLPFIYDAAVAGLPAEGTRGEAPWAWVVLQEDAKGMDKKEVERLVKEEVKTKLAKHKWLEEVKVIDSMPQLASGKKLVRELKRQALKEINFKKTNMGSTTFNKNNLGRAKL